ncbi:MAG: aminopeptidase P family protein [Cytophagales bacterium]|nr:aminopeptidase P family protein [Cytophaga sp.]
MKYTPIDKSVFITNRRKLSGKLLPASIAVFQSNDIYPTNADGTMPFRQNNDLFYCSGIDQEDTILLLFPDAADPKYKEVLFILETNEHLAVWEGHKLSKEEARDLSGIQTIFWAHEFEKVFKSLVYDAHNMYCNQNEHGRAEKLIETRSDRFITWCRQHYPLHAYNRLAPVLNELRSVKYKGEIEQISHACDITTSAFKRILKTIKPGIKEYEIEADITHEFIRSGSRGHAYQPIIASGASACILHYVQNDKVCKSGELILMDFGAEYGNYASDLTRVVPVNGKFSKRQKEIYTSVLSIFKQVKKAIKPGATLADLNKITAELVGEEIVRLKLISLKDLKKDPSASRRYFMHGIGHHLGLDVHDVHVKDVPLKAGMIITLEPGLYIKEEGIGIRLENDMLISAKGNVDLMEKTPIEAEEIELLMRN